MQMFMQNLLPWPSLCLEYPTSSVNTVLQAADSQVAEFPSGLPELICCILILVYTQILADKVHEFLQVSNIHPKRVKLAKMLAVSPDL